MKELEKHYEDLIIKYDKKVMKLEYIIDKVNEILYDDNLCHVEKLQEIHKILGDKE